MGLGTIGALDSETGQNRIERVGQTLREEPSGQQDTFQDSWRTKGRFGARLRPGGTVQRTGAGRGSGEWVGNWVDAGGGRGSGTMHRAPTGGRFGRWRTATVPCSTMDRCVEERAGLREVRRGTMHRALRNRAARGWDESVPLRPAPVSRPPGPPPVRLSRTCSRYDRSMAHCLAPVCIASPHVGAYAILCSLHTGFPSNRLRNLDSLRKLRMPTSPARHHRVFGLAHKESQSGALPSP